MPKLRVASLVWQLELVSHPRRLQKVIQSDRRPRLRLCSYFSFGGSVKPNTEIIPSPATLIFASPGVGR